MAATYGEYRSGIWTPWKGYRELHAPGLSAVALGWPPSFGDRFTTG